MIKYIILILTIVIVLTPLRASHLAGGHLDYQCIDSNTYLVTLTFFRDCSGLEIDPDDDGPILWRSSTECGYSCTALGAMEYIEHEEVDYGCGENCSGGAYPGFEKYIYQKTVILPEECPDWKFSINIAARNDTEFAGGGNYINYVMVNNEGGLCNNSPQFDNLSVWLGCVNTTTVFENEITEVDGDNLVFELTEPLVLGIGSSVCDDQVPIAYLGGELNASNPIPSLSGASVDPATGDITMTPTNTGTSYFAVKVKEYRDGVLIGESIRDGEIIIDNCTPSESITFGAWSDSGADSLWVAPESQDCFEIPIFNPTAINDIYVNNLSETLFSIEYDGIGTTTALVRICPLWEAFDNFCEFQVFYPEIVVSTEIEGCFLDGGSASSTYALGLYKEDWCRDYRFFTNRGPDYPLLPLPSFAKASEVIYIGDEMPPFSLIDPTDMGPVQGTGDHWFEAPEIIISCTGGGEDCVNFTAGEGSGNIVFKYGNALCSPECPNDPLDVVIHEVFECGNERVEIEILSGEPPYSIIWYDQNGFSISTDSVLNVHELVSDSTWNQVTKYSLYVEDMTGTYFTFSDSVPGTERFYREITDNMYLFTHPEYPEYPDSTYLYDANLYCSPLAPFFIFDGINDSPPWYGATDVQMMIFDRYGAIQYELNEDLENGEDWSFDNKEWSWDGTIGNSGDPDNCLDGTSEVFGDYRLIVGNCHPYNHEEIDLVGLIECYSGDWSDSIVVAMAPENGEGVYYNGVHFIRRNPRDNPHQTTENHSLVMYPNPASNSINVSGKDIEVELIKILDYQGKLILSVEKSTTVDVSLIASGSYIVQFWTNVGLIEKKLILQ